MSDNIVDIKDIIHYLDNANLYILEVLIRYIEQSVKIEKLQSNLRVERNTQGAINILSIGELYE